MKGSFVPFFEPGVANGITLADAVARMDAPEASLVAVANGDFSGMSEPYLVACEDAAQLNEFIFRNGLMCSEVIRVRRAVLGHTLGLADYPQDKIMLLLPGWDEDPGTRGLVHLWVNDLDRFTVELQTPRSLGRRTRNWVRLSVLGLAAWGVVGALWWCLRGSLNF